MVHVFYTLSTCMDLHSNFSQYFLPPTLRFFLMTKLTKFLTSIMIPSLSLCLSACILGEGGRMWRMGRWESTMLKANALVPHLPFLCSVAYCLLCSCIHPASDSYLELPFCMSGLPAGPGCFWCTGSLLLNQILSSFGPLGANGSWHCLPFDKSSTGGGFHTPMIETNPNNHMGAQLITEANERDTEGVLSLSI